MVDEKEEVKCTYCGEKEHIIKINETKTFDEPVCIYKCLKCNKTFQW